MGTILVADDNEQNSNILKDVLESWGYKVVVTASGDKVMACLAQEMPDVVLLDVMMPGLNGYEVCQQLRRLPFGNKLSIILLTALGEVEDRIHGYNVGADMFITKPVNYQELKVLLQNLLKRKKACSEVEPREKVINFLTHFLSDKSIKRQDNKEIIAVEEKYGKKLLQEMNLAPYTEKYLVAALRLQDMEEYFLSPYNSNMQQALAELELGNWLIPILTYGSNLKTTVLQSLEEQDNTTVMKVALVFLALKRYGQLYKEHKGNTSDALTALRRAAIAGECNRPVVEMLAGIINNRLLLEELA